MTDVEKINKELIKTHGFNPVGNPLFQIVWSEKATEMRQGIFNDFYNDIFIRQFTGVREVKKYSYIHERWILERWFPPEVCQNSELPMSYQGSYECIHVFENSKGEYVVPTIKIVSFLIDMANRPVRMTPEERRDIYLKMEDQEVQEFIESLEISPIANALHMKQGTGYTKEIKNAS
jgi:hypothetical protein